MIRIFFAALAILSVFFFPWPLTVAVVLIAACFVPAISLVAGLLSDLLYYAPHAHMVPFSTLLGLVGFGIGFGVHQFFKTRIIGG